MVSPDYADPDGWCSLGDTAMIRGNGYIHLTGRLDGMINTGSYHVYPDEVRDALETHTDVAQALVRGEPDPVWGQAVTAYVVPTTPDPHLADALKTRLRAQLAPYKIPKLIHIVEQMPAL
jgi:acyl-coenzyme A synthetase/AMP-(fatty) acid ligase